MIQHRKEWPLTMMCRLLQVSRSYFYQCTQPKSGIKKQGNSYLEKDLTAVFHHHHSNYGSRRLVKELRKKTHKVGRYKVRKLMNKLGLVAHRPRSYKATTDSEHNYPYSDNVLARNFDVKEPNRVWSTDITAIKTREGWSYLAIVVDLYSRQIIGWSVAKHMRTQLCLDALTMAWWRRRKPQGVMHHSDRGSQYASYVYREKLHEYSMISSMSRTGSCLDNSPTERVFRTLKTEWFNRWSYTSHEELEQAIWHYISYYNSKRLHSTLGYLSPMEFERQSNENDINKVSVFS